jgi:hypothetical protein
MNKDTYVDISSDLVDEYFPKGKCKERGEAMVLVAMLLHKLQEAGVVND